jgi:hypothetical protein
MERRKFTQEFNLEAAVGAAQAGFGVTGEENPGVVRTLRAGPPSMIA